MRLITGDECGLLKECLPSLSQRKHRNQSAESTAVKDEGVRVLNGADRPLRRRGVAGLAWTEAAAAAAAAEGGGRFASLRLDGSVQLWERRDLQRSSSSKSFAGFRPVCELGGVFVEDGAGLDDSPITPHSKPLGLASFCSGNGKKSLLAACNARGHVSVIEARDSELSIVRRFSTFDVPRHDVKPSIYPLVGCMGLHESNGWIGVGGKDRETTIYDLESTKKVWKAKNLPPNPQTLLQPVVWPSAMSFLSDGHRLVVGSDLQVRLYDVRVDSIQRRPVAHTPPGLLEQRVTAFCQAKDDALVVGDTAGYIYSLDLRNLSSSMDQARFVGPAGSVRQLVQHASLPRMAAVGLDRMLRLYDVKTRKQTVCLYLKQRLNCVLFDSSAVDRLEESEDDGEDAIEGTDRDADQADVVQDYVDSDQESCGGNSDDSDKEGSLSGNDAEELDDSEADDQDSSEADEVDEVDESGDTDVSSDEPRKRQRR